MGNYNSEYWNTRYVENQTGWDAGEATAPFVEYAKSLTDKDVKILIPGCGRAYEGELLHNLGFTNVTLLDYSGVARQNFLDRVPTFPSHHFLVGDFFQLNGSFDLILEQTFFCALNPKLRPQYAQKMHELLKSGGKLVGVLFKFPLTEQGPPFGGSKGEYESYFKAIFHIKTMKECYNSIKPRKGNELFIQLEKR